jgi:hypothetical protein
MIRTLHHMAIPNLHWKTYGVSGRECSFHPGFCEQTEYQSNRALADGKAKMEPLHP